jgi:putative peptide zinc metalloprotease protein
MKYCLGMEMPPERPMALWRRTLFVAYAVASYIYGWVVTFGAIWFLAQFLEPYRLGVVSKFLAVGALASMLGWPLYRLSKALYQRGKLPNMKPHRVSATIATLVELLHVFFLVPLPVGRVREPGLVQPKPDAVEKVFVMISGSLEKLHVRDGQTVRQGDILAEFRNLELEGQLEEARTQHAIRIVQLKALRQQAAEITDLQERARIEIANAQADGERKVYAQQIAMHEKTLQLLALQAPRSGVVMGSPRREEVGKQWEKDQSVPFCSIGDPARLRALMPVSPADYRLVKEDLGLARDLAVTVRVQGWASRTWSGRVAPLPESEAQTVPLALTTRAGGPLAIKPSSHADVYVPQNQCYLVAVDLVDAGSDGIWPGSMAQVKVHCRWRPAAWWVWRTINAAFDLGLVG